VPKQIAAIGARVYHVSIVGSMWHYALTIMVHI